MVGCWNGTLRRYDPPRNLPIHYSRWLDISTIYEVLTAIISRKLGSHGEGISENGSSLCRVATSVTKLYSINICMSTSVFMPNGLKYYCMRNCGGDGAKKKKTNMEDKLLPYSKVISRSVGLFAKLLVDLTGAGFQKVLVRRQKLP
jgi:hypothetical protein